MLAIWFLAPLPFLKPAWTSGSSWFTFYWSLAWRILSITLLAYEMSARRSNQSILKELSPGCSLEGMMLKLKLQYFGHLMRRVDLLEKTLMLRGIRAGGEGDDWGWDGWMASLTQWTWVWVNSGRWWTGRPGVLRFMESQRVGHDWDWTELNWLVCMCFLYYLLQMYTFTEV